MTPPSPLISVITIVRNCVGSVENTIRSVLDQSYPRIEYIVVDGGSTDGTCEIVERYAGRLARSISEPDRGISDALNKGSRLATGDLLLFLNAGDSLVDSTVLARVAAAIDPGADIRNTVFYGDALFVNAETSDRLQPDHERLREDSVLCHQSTLVGAEVQKANPYDERFLVAMDYDVWLRCLGRYDFVKLPVLISNFTAGGVSSSDKFVVRSIIERVIARILNGQQPANVATVAELFGDLAVISGKLGIKRLAGPEAYKRLKKAVGR